MSKVIEKVVAKQSNEYMIILVACYRVINRPIQEISFNGDGDALARHGRSSRGCWWTRINSFSDSAVVHDGHLYPSVIVLRAYA